MSRRTKLLFLAVFLVLLGTPVAYVALGLAPENPLRFHVVWDSTAPGAGVPEGAEDQYHTMLVENVSATPVYLQELRFVHSENASWVTKLNSIYTLGNAGESKVVHEIPPHSRVLLPMDARDHDGCVFGGLELVYYGWTTAPRLTARRTMKGLRKTLPESLRGFPPSFRPFFDAVKVEVVTNREAQALSEHTSKSH